MPLPHDFNLAGRREALTRLGHDRLDLLIVGGGITGCGIARDAALRGWTVALVEKEDFAFGTSSRSSKIVHGGVRYLEYGHFLLVKEAAQERAVLRTIAPHLVHPLPFVFPVFGGESLLKIRAGLTVFDFLATSDGLEKHENLSPEEVREQLPGLRDPLKGAVRYPEYITDDARLTLENAQSAAEHGALVVNHARVQDFRMTDGRVAGCSVVDLIENRTVKVSTRLIVNATGAWSAGLLAEAGFDAEFSLIPSKGIHILFSAERLPIEGATFLRATNGKRGLAMRRLGFVYVGTTDDQYDGSLDRPRATRSDVDEVLDMVSDCFPEQNLGYDDILATWAGVRPLIREEGKSTRDTSREGRGLALAPRVDHGGRWKAHDVPANGAPGSRACRPGAGTRTRTSGPDRHGTTSGCRYRCRRAGGLPCRALAGTSRGRGRAVGRRAPLLAVWEATRRSARARRRRSVLAGTAPSASAGAQG